MRNSQRLDQSFALRSLSRARRAKNDQDSRKNSRCVPFLLVMTIHRRPRNRDTCLQFARELLECINGIIWHKFVLRRKAREPIIKYLVKCRLKDGDGLSRPIFVKNERRLFSQTPTLTIASQFRVHRAKLAPSATSGRLRYHCF